MMSNANNMCVVFDQDGRKHKEVLCSVCEANVRAEGKKVVEYYTVAPSEECKQCGRSGCKDSTSDSCEDCKHYDQCYGLRIS